VVITGGELFDFDEQIYRSDDLYRFGFDQ